MTTERDKALCKLSSYYAYEYWVKWVCIDSYGVGVFMFEPYWDERELMYMPDRNDKYGYTIDRDITGEPFLFTIEEVLG